MTDALTEKSSLKLVQLLKPSFGNPTLTDAIANYFCCKKIRLLVTKNKCSISQIVKAGIIPRLIEFIREKTFVDLVIESLLILINISYEDTSEYTQEIVSNDGIKVIIEMISKTNDIPILDITIWALSNIIGDCVENRNLALKLNGLNVILHKITLTVFKIIINNLYNNKYLITDISNLIFKYYFDFDDNNINCKYNVLTIDHLSLLQTFSWILNNFVSKSSLELKYIKIILPTMINLLYTNDENTLKYTTEAFRKLTDVSNETDINTQNTKLDLISNSGCCNKLMKLLEYNNSEIQSNSVIALGYLIAFDSIGDITDKIVNLGILPKIAKLLTSNDNSTVKSSCWILSNIAANNGKYNYISQILKYNLLNVLVLDVLKSNKYNSNAKKEAIWAISNATITCKDIKQMKSLINNGCIEALFSFLNCENNSLVGACVQSVEHILNMCEIKNIKDKNNSNLAVKLIKECNGLEHMKSLIKRENLEEWIKFKTKSILEKYFNVKLK